MKKLLMISTDRKIFDKGSAVRARMIEYGQGLDELHIIIFAKKSAGFAGEKISENVFVYPTQSNIKIGYIFDAIKIGRRILSKNYQPSTNNLSVSSQDPFETGLVGVYLSRLFSTRLQIQVHTDFLSPYFRRGGVINIFRRLVGEYTILFADRVRVVSPRIQRSVCERLGIAPSQVDVAPIVVSAGLPLSMTRSDFLQKQYPQFEQIVMMASRLENEKNIPWAISSWVEVVKQFPKAGLIIVGEGSLRKNLEEQVKDLNLSTSILFVSWQRDLTPYYLSANLFLTTSWYEGYGITLVEAAQAQCPIITTDVGLVGDVLSRESVCIIEPEEKDSLSKTIISAFLNQETMKAKAIRASEEISKYTSDCLAFEKTLEKLFSLSDTGILVGKKTLLAYVGRLLRVDSLAGMMVKYVISGLTAALVDLGCLYVLIDVFHIWYIFSTALAFIIAFGVSFSMQKYWTFRGHSDRELHKQVVLYFAVSVFNLFLNTALVYVFVDYVGLHYLLAQIVTSTLIACESFLMYKFVIFARK